MKTMIGIYRGAYERDSRLDRVDTYLDCQWSMVWHTVRGRWRCFVVDKNSVDRRGHVWYARPDSSYAAQDIPLYMSLGLESCGKERRDRDSGH